MRPEAEASGYLSGAGLEESDRVLTRDTPPFRKGAKGWATRSCAAVKGKQILRVAQDDKFSGLLAVLLALVGAFLFGFEEAAHAV